MEKDGICKVTEGDTEGEGDSDSGEVMEEMEKAFKQKEKISHDETESNEDAEGEDDVLKEMEKAMIQKGRKLEIVPLVKKDDGGDDEAEDDDDDTEVDVDTSAFAKNFSEMIREMVGGLDAIQMKDPPRRYERPPVVEFTADDDLDEPLDSALVYKFGEHSEYLGMSLNMIHKLVMCYKFHPEEVLKRISLYKDTINNYSAYCIPMDLALEYYEAPTSLKLVKELIKCGSSLGNNFDPDVWRWRSGRDGLSILHYVIWRPIPHLELYEYLFDLGISPNYVIEHGDKTCFEVFCDELGKLKSKGLSSKDEEEFGKIYELFISKGAIWNDDHIYIRSLHKQISELKEIVSKLKEENKVLKEHIELQPDGEEFLELKESFKKKQETPKPS